MKCASCGKDINDTAGFCVYCGAKVNPGSGNAANNAVAKIKNSAFVSSLGKDIKNSESLKLIKKKTADAAGSIRNATGSAVKQVQNADDNKKKIILIAAVAAVFAVIVLIVATHIHRCDECDKVYFGSKHTVSILGEEANLCKDCYDDLNDFSSWF